MALLTARLTAIKTLENFNFTFHPSSHRYRIRALAQLEFVERVISPDRLVNAGDLRPAVRPTGTVIRQLKEFLTGGAWEAKTPRPRIAAAGPRYSVPYVALMWV